MSETILLVDDEPRILQSLVRLLRRDGHEILTAENGPAALELLAEHEVATIVCDQRMPGMSGAEVLAEAYKLRPDAVRITITGYTDLASAQASINEGHVNHYLLKPWDDEHLRSVVRDGVRTYRLVQDNRRLEEITRNQKKELAAWNKRLKDQVYKRTDELRERNKQLMNLHERLEESLRGSVALLAGTLEAASPNLGIHSKRVSQLAVHLASRLGMTGEQLREVEFAAHLHDLGKLAKAAAGDGRSRLRGTARPGTKVSHSDAGFAILSKVPGFEPIAEAVRYQCSPYHGGDRQGGPSQDEIPITARIIAVVDAYDEAVYRADAPTNVSLEAGRTTILEGSGKRFDPMLVEELLAHLDEIGSGTGSEIEVELSPKNIKPGMILSRSIRNHDGVLLLKEETELRSNMIQRIRDLGRVDPLLTSVYVKCTSVDMAEVADEDAGAGRQPMEEPR